MERGEKSGKKEMQCVGGQTQSEGDTETKGTKVRRETE